MDDLKVVSRDTLNDLIDLKEEAELAQSEAQAVAAKFQAKLASAFRSVKAPISDSSLCLSCGEVRPKQQGGCKKCVTNNSN